MLKTIPCRDNLFKETSKHHKEVLQEYFNSPINSIGGPWEFIPIFDILCTVNDNTSSFKSIKENINSVDDYSIIALGVSTFPSGFPSFPHIDKHSEIKSFKRYHLPLQLTDTSYLYVKEDGSEEFNKYPWELGKWMEFTGLDKVHYPLNEDENGTPRIILILDIVEGIVTDENVYDYYANTEELGWTKNKDFRPYYEKYISEKKNK